MHPASTAAENSAVAYEPLKAGVEVLREDLMADLAKHLTRGSRFVALRGVDGAGKSFFLRQQFLPKLIAGELNTALPDESDWKVAFFRPQVNPISTLAQSLALPGLLRNAQDVQPFWREEIESKLRNSNDGIVNLYRDAAERMGHDFPLLIVVDELEEMFRLREMLIKNGSAEFAHLSNYFKPTDDELLLSLFLRAIKSDYPIYVLFAIGNKSLGHLNNFQGWSELISQSRFNLPIITASQIERALFRSASPEVRQEVHPVLSGIYHKIVDIYRKGKAGDLIARVNVALDLLTQRSRELLASGMTISDEAYYEKLSEKFDRIDDLPHEVDYLCDGIYERMSPVQRTVTKRLFQTITRKDPTPGRFALSAPCTFKSLKKICFRNGEEYPSLLKSFPAADEEVTKVPTGQATDLLIDIINRFRFPDQSIPNLIKIINPADLATVPPSIDDETIIEIGQGNLIQDWTLLKEWADLEFNGVALYNKLLEESSKLEKVLLDSSKRETREMSEEFVKVNYLREWWNSITGNIRSVADQTKDTLSRFRWGKKQKSAERSAEKLDLALKKEEIYLNEGQLELAGDWFVHELPNASWAYRSQNGTRQFSNGRISEILTEALAENRVEFERVVTYVRSSRQYREGVRAARKAKLQSETKSQIRRANILLYALGIALLFICVGVYQKYKANQAKQNLKLLDFVDTMSKANIISDDVYQSNKFHDLKDLIENNDDIHSIPVLIDSLAEWKLLQLGEEEDQLHVQLSKKALLQLDQLIHNYHAPRKEQFFQIVDEIIANAERVDTLNKDKADAVKYQYPYVYQALYEAKLALVNNIGSKGECSEPGNSHSRIQAIASNPEKTKKQFVTGNASGEVRIFDENGCAFNKLGNINSNISSMAYAHNGKRLFASTFSGKLYLYEPVNSIIQPASPKTYDEEQIEPTEIKILAQSSQGKLPILSVHTFKDESYLLLQGNRYLRLLLREGTSSYRQIDQVELMQEHGMKSLNTTTINGDGYQFIVGGAEKSLVMELAVDQRPRKSKIQYLTEFEHPGFSVSAIAFDQKRPGGVQHFAFGTEEGQTGIIELNDFFQYGKDYFKNNEAQLTSTQNIENNFQESGITGLVFNHAENHQLISTSLDGSVFIYNLEFLNGDESIYFFKKDEDQIAWDHLKLVTNGRSITHQSMVSDDLLIAVDNGNLQTWSTTISPLLQEVRYLLSEFKQLKQ